MSSVETEMLLRELESSTEARVSRLPLPLYDADMSIKEETADFDKNWDNKHFVKFPCSTRNTYRLKADPTNYLSKWKLICESLSAPMASASDLEDVILSYSPTFIGQWSFGSLYEFCASLPSGTTFWSTTLPYMANMAQKLDSVFSEALPLLPSQSAIQVTVSQEQCAVLVANMFFCTFPQRSCNSAHGGNGTGVYENYPNVNFNTLFATHENKKRANRRVEKLRCIVHYFESLAERGIPDGKVSIRRNVLLGGAVDNTPSGGIQPVFVGDAVHAEVTEAKVKAPQWTLSTAPLLEPELRVRGTIEDDGLNCWQVDFANMVIGGGVIGAGCVQEEIRFVINPECLVSRLVCERLASNESILILGAQRYSNYTGYSDTFEWSGHHEDETPRDAVGRRRTYITAIDAVMFPFNDAKRQFRKEYIYRELNKAFIGFLASAADEKAFTDSSPGAPAVTDTPSSSTNDKPPTATEGGHANWPIATGHWGCGAFNGDKHLKAVIQWVAASQVGRPLYYFAFGDEQFTAYFKSLVKHVMSSGLRSGDIIQHTLAYRPGPGRNLFGWLRHCINKTGGGQPEAHL